MHSAALTYVCALALVLLIPFCGGGIDRPPIEDLSSETVTYETADGVRIEAGWFPPPGVTKPPVVILLHEENGTRAQWDGLVGILVKEGYAVLAPDIRGHGGSTTVIRDGQPEPYQFSGSAAEAIEDVGAAIEWLKGQDNVDVNRVGVIGARLGAMLSYASTAIFPEVRAAVSITPPPYVPNSLDPLYAAIPDFVPHDVFIMAGGRRQWEESVTLGIRITFPKGRRYIETPDLEGVALLANDEMIKDTLQFFEERVRLAATATATPSAPN